MVKGANEMIKMALQYYNPGTMLEHLYVEIKIPLEKISKEVIDHARALDSKKRIANTVFYNISVFF